MEVNLRLVKVVVVRSLQQGNYDRIFPPNITNIHSRYLCPQCSAKYCELPVECRGCGLTLVSAPHLARSYHHLFPMPPFQVQFYNF